MYTPGEIVESRRSLTARTFKDALNFRTHGLNRTNVRVVDEHGTVIFDQPLARGLE
jgi:hypothetical protein